jgi:hypothetical protein
MNQSSLTDRATDTSSFGCHGFEAGHGHSALIEAKGVDASRRAHSGEAAPTDAVISGARSGGSRPSWMNVTLVNSWVPKNRFGHAAATISAHPRG